MFVSENKIVPVFLMPVEDPKEKPEKPGKEPDPSEVPETGPPKIKEPPAEKQPAVREPDPDEIRRKA
jgi:hypothetical protein